MFSLIPLLPLLKLTLYPLTLLQDISYFLLQSGCGDNLLFFIVTIECLQFAVYCSSVWRHIRLGAHHFVSPPFSFVFDVLYQLIFMRKWFMVFTGLCSQFDPIFQLYKIYYYTTKSRNCMKIDL